MKIDEMLTRYHEMCVCSIQLNQSTPSRSHEEIFIYLFVCLDIIDFLSSLHYQELNVSLGISFFASLSLSLYLLINFFLNSIKTLFLFASNFNRMFLFI